MNQREQTLRQHVEDMEEKFDQNNLSTLFPYKTHN